MLSAVTAAVLLGLPGGCFSAAGGDSNTSALARLTFRPSMRAGFRDANGRNVAGTEVMHLAAYKHRLYAGNSLWMERDPAVPKACQILVLDSPGGAWRVEHQFSTNNLRMGCLKAVTFTADAKGDRMPATPVLLAAPDVRRGPMQIFSRDDASGRWIPMTLGTADGYTTTRAIGLHRDLATGIERVYAGADKPGVIRGAYDPAVPGRIHWEPAPEMPVPAGERVMGFCDCDGGFYCATSRHIFQRADGTNAAWREVYLCAREISPCGIRGLTAIPNPSGRGEALLFAALGKVRRLDPSDGFRETIELDLPAFLTARGGIKLGFALAAYNEFMPYAIPSTGERVWLFGFESRYPPTVVEAQPPPSVRLLSREDRRGYFAAEARLCIRHAKGREIRYEVVEVADLRKTALVAVRAIAKSPFEEDRGKALYLGGFDCNSIPSHDTAWIYRAEWP